jgi:hypothetical protein
MSILITCTDGSGDREDRSSGRLPDLSGFKVGCSAHACEPSPARYSLSNSSVMASSSSGAQSKGSQVVVIGMLFTVIAATTVALRLFTRLVILRSPGREDILIVLALVSTFVLDPFLVLGEIYLLKRRDIVL